MAIEVRIPTILRTYTGGEKAVDASGATLGGADRRPGGQPPRHQGAAGRGQRRAAPLRQRLRQRRGRPVHRWARHGAHRRRRRSSSCPPSPAADDASYDNLLALGRQHAAGRAADACRRRPTSGSGRSSRTATRPARSRTAPALEDDRAGREGRHAPPRLHDPRADVRQHRHLAGDGRQAQGLPAGLRDAREHLRGAPPAAAHVGRRDRLLARRRRLQRGGPGGQADGRGAPRLGDALPVRQPRQRARALRGHRPRDPRRPAVGHPLRRRARHHRHADGRRPLLPRARARGRGSSPPSRATASWSTACATSTRASSPSCTTRR